MAQNVQSGTKSAAQQFNKFIDEGAGTSTSGSGSRSVAEPERREFWDSFGGTAGEEAGVTSKVGAVGKGSAIGTAAVRKGGKEEGWDEDRWEKF